MNDKNHISSTLRTAEVFKGMRNLKIIWSSAAVTGLAWSWAAGEQGKNIWLWILTLIFAAFNDMWLH